MKDKYRIQFFKNLYDSLELGKYEEALKSGGVQPVSEAAQAKAMSSEEIMCRQISKYFYLLNDVNIEALTPEELKYLEGINSETPASEVASFLKDTYGRVLFSQDDSDKVYYGPLKDPGYEADKDDIAIGLKYDCFGLSYETIRSEDEIKAAEETAKNIAKQIQENSPIKIRVITYNELFEMISKENELIPAF